MARNYSNIAFDTTLVAGIGAGDLSLVVASATGWPAVPFAAVLDPGLVTEEVVQVTIKAGTTFTITRGFDGTTAAAHALGATVRHSAIAGDFTDLQAADTSEASTRATADSALSTAISNEASTRAAADALLTPMARTLTINGVTFDLSANRSWTVSAGSGTVTSVDLTVPGVLFSVSGNPVTTSGTLALSLLTQTANTVLAGPVSGGAATPTMRALVAADIPAISLTAGVSGILPSANGGTGVNNAGTLTNATNTTITGGGTLALGGFTLTVPATGTAALLSVSNLFTVRQDIRAAGGANAAGLYVPWITGDALPTVRVGALTVGNNQIALYAESRTARAIYAETTSGASAINAVNAGGIGVDATGTTNGVKGNGGSGIGVYGLTTSGQAVYGEATSTGVPLYGIRGSALTNSAGSLLKLEMGSSGTPLANFGATVDIFLKSSTTATQQAAQSSVVWADPTHATRKARRIEYVYDTAAREVLRGEADGTNPMIGFLGAAATARVAVTGSRGGNAALASLLTELASKGLITDSTSA